jgi:hypothetical protein
VGFHLSAYENVLTLNALLAASSNSHFYELLMLGIIIFRSFRAFLFPFFQVQTCGKQIFVMVGSHPHRRLRKRLGDIPQLLILVEHGVKTMTLVTVQMCGQVFHLVLDLGEQQASGEQIAPGLVVVCGEVRLVGL